MLYIVYFAASTSIVLILMNIIIAVMGEVQAQRGEKGRSVVYSTQLKVVIDNYAKYNHMITAGDVRPAFLTMAYKREDDEDDDDDGINDETERNFTVLNNRIDANQRELLKGLTAIKKAVSSN